MIAIVTNPHCTIQVWFVQMWSVQVLSVCSGVVCPSVVCLWSSVQVFSVWVWTVCPTVCLVVCLSRGGPAIQVRSVKGCLFRRGQSICGLSVHVLSVQVLYVWCCLLYIVCQCVVYLFRCWVSVHMSICPGVLCSGTQLPLCTQIYSGVECLFTCLSVQVFSVQAHNCHYAHRSIQVLSVCSHVYLSRCSLFRHTTATMHTDLFRCWVSVHMSICPGVLCSGTHCHYAHMIAEV